MKTDFNFNVQVSLGVTPELEAAVKAAVECLQRGAVAETVLQYLMKKVKDTDADAEAPQTEEQPGAQPEQEAPQKALTEEDVRAAMHRTRQRIEGEDYKEHTDSEAYRKYHKELTAKFKGIATFLGAEKPSLIPAENRASFVAQCDELTILPDGTVGCNVPF